MAASSSWLSETTRTYFGNAASRKDFRVQMRGSKPFWVFTVYVFCLCLIGLVAYVTTIGREGLSLASAQSELTGFFNALMLILAAAICLIAPGLTGSAIVSERQRLSLDLVMSAPVEPKYLLVGKMISSYRYIWMLLILALPVVAMSVVLGGATWSDVFLCFILLSFQAMIFTSIALLISSVTNKPASAVIWSLIAVWTYVYLSTTISVVGASGAFVRGGSSNLPFVVSLSPFMVLQAVNSTTAVGSWNVPNWIIGIGLALLLTRLFLLGAAVNLAPLDKKLSASLRITGLVYTFGLSFLLLYALGNMGMLFGSPSAVDSNTGLSYVAHGCVSWLFLWMPYFACYSKEGSRRYWFNGRFSIRHIFDGTPAGNLPYIFALIASSYLGALFGAQLLSSTHAGFGFTQTLLWAVGYYVLLWSVGQLLSASTTALKTARVWTFVILWAPTLLFLIVMALAQLNPPWSGGDPTYNRSSGLWYLWPYAPFADQDLFKYAWAYGAVMLGLGVLITGLARSRETRRSLRVANA